MTNCKITLCSNGTFTVIPAWYEETNAQSVSKIGFDASNKANVLYDTCFVRPNFGDYIIRGEYSGGSVEELIKAGALKVMSIAMLDYGSFPHYEIGLR